MLRRAAPAPGRFSVSRAASLHGFINLAPAPPWREYLLYLPGKFGIRLEDCFHMTAAGPKWFTIPPRSIDDPIGHSAA